MRTFLFCYEASNSFGGMVSGDAVSRTERLTPEYINGLRKFLAEDINKNGRSGYTVIFRSITELDQPEE